MVHERPNDPSSHKCRRMFRDFLGGAEQSRVGEAAGRRNCPEAVPEEQRGRKGKNVPGQFSTLRRAKRRHARKRERIPSFPQCFMVECGPRLALVKGRRGMVICDRLRALREEKKLSQGDIEKRTGLLRCYISRVENGHTVPAIETLEKLARALEVPLYQLFYDGEEPPQLPNLPKRKSSDDIAWGSVGKEARFLNKLRRLLSKAEEGDRKLILYMAQKMANR